MNKKRFFDLLYVILVISLIVFMIWIVQFLKGDAKQCLKDPINYFEEKNKGVSCYCMKNDMFYNKKESNNLVVSQDNFNLE